MNSLEDLNGLNDTTSYEYVDNRDPQLIFDLATAADSAVTVLEGQSHNIPYTINIVEVVNYDAMTSFYEIDLSAMTDAVVIWPTLPAHMTSSTPSTGVFRVEGFQTVADWDVVKLASVGLPNALTGEYDYTATLGYTVDGATTDISWTITLTIEETNLFTAVSDFFWNISSTANITGFPQVNDDGISTPTYTITITASDKTGISSLSSTGIGGSSSYNAVDGVLNISGTKAQVNSHLENIQFVSTATAVNFTLTYVVLSSIAGETDTKVQSIKCNEIRYLSLISTPTIVYDEDTNVSVSGGPQITDIDYDGSGTYVIAITGVGVRNLTATGTGGSTSYDATTRTLTIIGDRTQVNSYINNITLSPKADYASNFNLTYTVTTPRSGTQSKSQLMQIGALDPEITGISGVTRYYAKNTATYIFGNTNYIDTSGNPQVLSQTTPAIVDLDPTNPNYTLTLSVSSTSKFSIDGRTETSSLQLTGSKASVNSQLSGVRFYAPKNASTNITITLTLNKGSGVYFTTTFVLSRQDTGGTTFTRTYVISSSQTFVPDIDSRRYSSNANVFVMGGGGAGTRGAGGGGGGVRTTTSTSFSTSTYTTYPITIGAGGTPTYGYNLTTEQLAVARGGTTTAFGLSAEGGYGGIWTRVSSSDNKFTGGSSGPYNGAANNSGFTTGAFTDSQLTTYDFGGVGGAGAATADYPLNNGGTIVNVSKRGSLVTYQSGYGWSQGGSGGPGIEFPAGSKTWYGGGGSGSGGRPEYNLSLTGGYNTNAAPGFYDSNGLTTDYPDPATYPYYALPIKYHMGGGAGRAQTDNPITYTYWDPDLPNPKQNGHKGGGGGGSYTDISGYGGGAGGSGVAIIQYNP